MFSAIDLFGVRRPIETVFDRESYFCPICRNPVMVRNYEDRRRHFAHIGDHSGNNSGKWCDGWGYDISEWHRNWQLRFPEECREIILEFDGKRHIADVLIGNTVIEFQHSSMSAEEFAERNKFYTDHGYKVVWLFDQRSTWDNHGIYLYPLGEDNQYGWRRSRRTLKEFSPQSSRQVMVYLQLEGEDDLETDGLGEIIRFSWKHDSFRYFFANEELSSKDFRMKFYQSEEDTVERQEAIKRMGGRTILDWLEDYEPDTIGVRNLRTQTRAKVGGRYRNTNRGQNVFGYLGRGNHEYNDQRCEIFYSNSPEWVMDWMVKDGVMISAVTVR